MTKKQWLFASSSLFFFFFTLQPPQMLPSPGRLLCMASRPGGGTTTTWRAKSGTTMENLQVSERHFLLEPKAGPLSAKREAAPVHHVTDYDPESLPRGSDSRSVGRLGVIVCRPEQIIPAQLAFDPPLRYLARCLQRPRCNWHKADSDFFLKVFI